MKNISDLIEELDTALQGINGDVLLSRQSQGNLNVALSCINDIRVELIAQQSDVKRLIECLAQLPEFALVQDELLEIIN